MNNNLPWKKYIWQFQTKKLNIHKKLNIDIFQHCFYKCVKVFHYLHKITRVINKLKDNVSGVNISFRDCLRSYICIYGPYV